MQQYVQQQVITQYAPNKTLVRDMSQLGTPAACALYTELPDYCFALPWGNQAVDHHAIQHPCLWLSQLMMSLALGTSIYDTSCPGPAEESPSVALSSMLCLTQAQVG